MERYSVLLNHQIFNGYAVRTVIMSGKRACLLAASVGEKLQILPNEGSELFVKTPIRVEIGICHAITKTEQCDISIVYLPLRAFSAKYGHPRDVEKKVPLLHRLRLSSCTGYQGKRKAGGGEHSLHDNPQTYSVLKFLNQQWRRDYTIAPARESGAS